MTICLYLDLYYFVLKTDLQLSTHSRHTTISFSPIACCLGGRYPIPIPKYITPIPYLPTFQLNRLYSDDDIMYIHAYIIAFSRNFAHTINWGPTTNWWWYYQSKSLIIMGACAFNDPEFTLWHFQDICCVTKRTLWTGPSILYHTLAKIWLKIDGLAGRVSLKNSICVVLNISGLANKFLCAHVHYCNRIPFQEILHLPLI